MFIPFLAAVAVATAFIKLGALSVQIGVFALARAINAKNKYRFVLFMASFSNAVAMPSHGGVN